MFGAATCALFTLPFFWLVDSGVTALVWLAPVVAMALFHAAMYGPQAAFFSELFGTRVRYSGASVGYQLGGMISGGFTPFIAAALLAWAGACGR